MGKFKPPKFISRRELRRILRSYGCEIRPDMGKGGHWGMTRKKVKCTLSYAVGDHREYGRDYINPIRRAMELTSAHGVSDRDFYSKR